MEKQQETNWARIAAWVFGCWAVMIPVGVTMVRSAVSDIVTAQTQFQSTFNTYVLSMERRMVLVEERQLQVLRRLEAIDDVHEYVPRNGNGTRK